MNDHDSYSRRLLHRWLVQYNPLYLVSAMLVLGGMILTSRGLAHEGSLYGELGVAAIAELYAATLIGGAALLVRIGERRPAVMLALLTVLYQCDLTLHTETCPYLGGVGVIATVGWLALFVVKLRALAWALKVRITTHAQITATVVAAGVAFLPYVLGRVDQRAGGAVVALWVFAIASLFGARGVAVTSEVELDDWGRVVLRRVVGASWGIAGLLFAGHVLFWSTQHALSLATLAPVAALVVVRRARNEVRAWMIVGATLVATAVVMPGAFAVTALVAAIALGMRAMPGAGAGAGATDAEVVLPYRMVHSRFGEEGRGVPEARKESVFGAFRPVEAAERLRLLGGAVFAGYLGVWTASWVGGAWPAHVIALDVALGVVVLLLAWRAKMRITLPALGVAYLHFVVKAHLVPAPRSLLEWGGTAVVLGFALLVASLAASYRLRRTARVDERMPPVRSG